METNEELAQLRKVIEQKFVATTSEPIPKARREEILETALRVYERSAEVLPRLSIEGYEVACGHQVEARARIKGVGVKFIAHSQWDSVTSSKHLQAVGVIAGVFHTKAGKFFNHHTSHYGQKDPEEKENPYKGHAADTVQLFLMNKYGPDIQKILDGLRPDPASQEKAAQQLVNNKKRSMDAARRAALERLSFAMDQFNYSEEEVVEAWQMSQVRRVMNS